MSRKPRTLVVTLAARSFSSLEPGATFCLSSAAIVSFAVFTAWVPGPALAAGVVAAGAAAAGFEPFEDDAGCAPASADASTTGRAIGKTIERREIMGSPVRDGGPRHGIHRQPDRGVPRRRSIGRRLAPSARASGTMRCRRPPDPWTP